jgi:hypothetical protein
VEVGERAIAALDEIRENLQKRIAGAVAPPVVDVPTSSKAKWTLWTVETLAALSLGVDQWRVDAELQNVRIVGGLATGGPLALRSSTTFAATIRSRLSRAHAPDKVADAIADAIWQAWKSWADGVTIPALPWYPAFFAWPGPVAPPLPNTPCPLALCVSARMFEMLPDSLAAGITTRLAGSTIEGSENGIATLSRHVSAAFLQWLASTQVTMAIGAGTTATAFPYMPLAPVHGSVIHSRGCLASGPPLQAGLSAFIP